MKKIFIAIFFMLGSREMLAQNPCRAVFSYSPLSPYTIQFTDQSSNAMDWFWDFGDMTASKLQNPVRTYTAPGNYMVHFFMFDTLVGCTDDTAMLLKIPIDTSACKAGFSFEIKSNLTVHFTDTSWFPDDAYEIWTWDFGDGSSSSEQHPVHTYLNAGEYLVCLSILDSIGWCKESFCDTIVIDSTQLFCTADFTFTVDGKNAHFTNLSTSNTTLIYEWGFGDGTGSNVKDPDHTYIEDSLYLVCLSVTDSTGMCTDAVCKYVEIAGDTSSVSCEAAFDFTVDSTGTGIKFNHNCLGSYLFNWDFGDGNFSSFPHPFHQYQKDSLYAVCLAINDTLNFCRDTLCKIVEVQKQEQKEHQVIVIKKGEQNINSYIYPNPSTKQATLYLAETSSDFLFSIFDRTGKLVFRQENIQGNNFTFNTALWAEGLYLYYAAAENEWKTSGKFVIGLHRKE